MTDDRWSSPLHPDRPLPPAAFVVGMLVFGVVWLAPLIAEWGAPMTLPPRPPAPPGFDVAMSFEYHDPIMVATYSAYVPPECHDGAVSWYARGDGWCYTQDKPQPQSWMARLAESLLHRRLPR